MRQVEESTGAAEFGAPARDPSRRFAWIVAGIIVLLLAGLFTAKPIYRHFKKNRALALVAASNELIRSNRWEEVGRNVKLALRLAPQEPSVLRLTARLCARHNAVEGINYWQLLLTTPDATREDRLDYARHAQRVGRFDLAGKELAGLLQTNKHDREALSLGLQVVQQKGDQDGVIRFGKILIGEFPTDPEAMWLAGSAYAAAREASVRSEGRGLLWGLAVGNSPFRELALRRLSDDAELSQGELDALVHAVRPGDTTSPLEASLLKLKLRLRRHPEKRAELVAEAVKLVPKERPALERAQLAHWLLEHREGARMLDLLPIDDVRRDPILLQYHLQAAAELKRWPEVNALLEDPDLPLDAVILHCFRGVADRIGGRGDHAAAHFSNATSAAKKRPDQLLIVARYAELCGAIPAAIEAREHLLYFPQLAAESAREVVRLAQQLDDLSPSLGALRRLAQFVPEDRILQNELTYVQLVLNTRDPEINARARRLFDERPDFLPNRMLWALCNLRENRAAEALALVEGQKVDWAAAPPRTQSIYAAILGANNLRDAARKIARKVDVSRLKPQERSLIEAWL